MRADFPEDLKDHLGPKLNSCKWYFPAWTVGYIYLCVCVVFFLQKRKAYLNTVCKKTNHQNIIALISPQSQRPVSDVAIWAQSISQTQWSDVVGQHFNCLLNHNLESDGWKREIGAQLYYSLFPWCLQITGMSQKQFKPVLSTILTKALYSSSLSPPSPPFHFECM